MVLVVNLLANARDVRDSGSIPGLRRSPEEGMATHSSILAWGISWTEEPGDYSSYSGKELDPNEHILIDQAGRVGGVGKEYIGSLESTCTHCYL